MNFLFILYDNENMSFLGQQKKSPSSAPVKTRSVRFKPFKGVYAFVELSPRKQKFAADIAGIVFDQSFRGCSLILQLDVEPKPDQLMRLKLGPLKPLLAQVRWIRALDKGIYKIGFEFIE